MKIVIPYSQGRVSPVFDVAEHFYLVEIKDGRELARREFRFAGGGIFPKTRMLSEFNPDAVICGAISGIQENALRNAGIRLVPFVCGEVDEVLKAFIQGRLTNGAFHMPGCCGRRRRYGYRGGRRN
ncbi:MAG: NifB/NifX family molybdenum-iron cluster-binding protein [Victivallaceae bacterium]|nr:NifB/NifX family molybdenum-iron cluster-binding protein [Victivallaceae bacterium]